MLTLSSPGQFNQLPWSLNITELLDCDLEDKDFEEQGFSDFSVLKLHHSKISWSSSHQMPEIASSGHAYLDI